VLEQLEDDGADEPELFKPTAAMVEICLLVSLLLQYGHSGALLASLKRTILSKRFPQVLQKYS
jgi:hypothetical protein